MASAPVPVPESPRRQCGEIVKRQLGIVGNHKPFPVGVAGDVAADGIRPQQHIIRAQPAIDGKSGLQVGWREADEMSKVGVGARVEADDLTTGPDDVVVPVLA